MATSCPKCRSKVCCSENKDGKTVWRCFSCRNTWHDTTKLEKDMDDFVDSLDPQTQGWFNTILKM